MNCLKNKQIVRKAPKKRFFLVYTLYIYKLLFILHIPIVFYK